MGACRLCPLKQKQHMGQMLQPPGSGMRSLFGLSPCGARHPSDSTPSSLPSWATGLGGRKRRKGSQKVQSISPFSMVLLNMALLNMAPTVCSLRF